MTLARTVSLGGLLLALAMGRPLGAQRRSTIELGASYVRFPVDSTSITGPSIRWVASQAFGKFASSAALSGVASGSGASGYGEIDGRWLTPVAAGWGVELGGEGGALVSTASSPASPWSTNLVTSARLLRSVGEGGVWARANGSVADREAGLLWGRGVDVGAWWRRTELQSFAAIAREWTVAQLFTGPGRSGFAGVVPVHYTEASTGLIVERGTASLAVTGVLRRDPDAEQLWEAGYTATATVWHSPTQAVLLGVARQLPDFIHGADASRSVTLAVRLNEPSPAVARVRGLRPTVQVGDVVDSAALGGINARRALRVRAPAARTVEVMGDFTDWEPAALAPEGDVFSATFELAPGSHRLVIRIDGGPWIPAANTPAVDDDFGGKVGLLVVQ